jgi:hypothetical protein
MPQTFTDLNMKKDSWLDFSSLSKVMKEKADIMIWVISNHVCACKKIV